MAGQQRSGLGAQRPGLQAENNRFFWQLTAKYSHQVRAAIPEELIDFTWTPELSAGNWHDSCSANTDRVPKLLVAEENNVCEYACHRLFQCN